MLSDEDLRIMEGARVQTNASPTKQFAQLTSSNSQKPHWVQAPTKMQMPDPFPSTGHVEQTTQHWHCCVCKNIATSSSISHSSSSGDHPPTLILDDTTNSSVSSHSSASSSPVSVPTQTLPPDIHVTDFDAHENGTEDSFSPIVPDSKDDTNDHAAQSQSQMTAKYNEGLSNDQQACAQCSHPACFHCWECRRGCKNSEGWRKCWRKMMGLKGDDEEMIWKSDSSFAWPAEPKEHGNDDGEADETLVGESECDKQDPAE